MREREDAYGRLLLDHLEGRPAAEIVERDDGFIAANRGPLNYFEPYRRRPSHQRRALRLARGRILDVGCGAGRVALHLQERGLDVVAVDISPLSVEVARRRGVRDARVVRLEDVDERLGDPFDTVVMYGGNFGLFGSRRGAGRLLRRLHSVTSARARILAETRDPYATDDEAHLAYHARDRMSGQVRIRVRHRSLATPWFDYLFVSRDEMRSLVDGTGWRVRRFVDPHGALYVAVLEKR